MVACWLALAAWFVACVVQQCHPWLSRRAGRCRLTYPLVSGVASCRCNLGGRWGLRCEGGTVWWGALLYGAMLPDGRVVRTLGPFVVRCGSDYWTVACAHAVWVVPPWHRRRVQWVVRFLDWWTGCRPRLRPAIE